MGTFPQPDLFGEYDAHRAQAEQAAAERAAWMARFERRWFEAPYDTAGGTKKGTPVHGWVCPACDSVEWNPCLLAINHGYDPHWPGSIPYRGTWGETCATLELERRHAEYDAKTAREATE